MDMTSLQRKSQADLGYVQDGEPRARSEVGAVRGRGTRRAHKRVWICCPAPRRPMGEFLRHWRTALRVEREALKPQLEIKIRENDFFRDQQDIRRCDEEVEEMKARGDCYLRMRIKSDAGVSCLDSRGTD